MQPYTVRERVPDEGFRALESFSPLVSELLYHRGVHSKEAADRFLYPHYENHLHDPFLLTDMEKAVARIERAIEHRERIVIYSDYDCDGIPGGVLLRDVFNKIGHEEIENYIPHRHTEGFGLHVEAIEKLHERGARLVITVDCGITDVEPVARANELGIDVIITDHHLPGEKMPEAYAIINPKRPRDVYPFKDLAGAGVAFKLAQALVSRKQFAIPPGWEKWLLDMAGLGTMADMVPLHGENRAIAHYGLMVLRKSKRPGLQALLAKARIAQPLLTEDDVGFTIAPRVNAASRMDKPQVAFELLSTRERNDAEVYAEHLNRMNDVRKGLVAAMARDIKKRLSHTAPRELIVMGDPRWKPGLLGLAANTLVEEYRRPVFLWGRDESVVIKGSCRSDGTVNVVSLMREVGDIFLDYGGHAQSGGFSISHEAIHTLPDMLYDAFTKVDRAVGTNTSILIDKELPLAGASWETYRDIERLAPFGEGNPKPVFLFKNVRVDAVSPFGKEQNHILVKFSDGSASASGIKFFSKAASFSSPPEVGALRSLIASLEQSTFRGRRELRLRIIDIV